MATYAIVSPEGDVLNLIEWDGESPLDVSPNTLEEADGQMALTQEASPVTSVTPRQMRKALRKAGLLDQVNAFVDHSGPDAQDDWEYATSIERDNELIVGGAAALGMTTRQVDSLFVLAATF